MYTYCVLCCRLVLKVGTRTSRAILIYLNIVFVELHIKAYKCSFAITSNPINID